MDVDGLLLLLLEQWDTLKLRWRLLVALVYKQPQKVKAVACLR